MSSAERSPGSRILQEDATEDMADNSSEATEPAAKRRRVFLQTMGQQLRDVGALRDSAAEIPANLASSVGEASQIQSLNDVSRGDRSQGRQVQIQTPESDAVPGEEDQLPTGATMSASTNLWQPSEVVTPVTDGADTFTFDDLLAWSNSYFDNWHPAYPFLHAPSVLEYFDHIVHHGLLELGPTDSSTYQRTILRSIISISLADRRQRGAVLRPVPTQLVFSSFNDAIQSVQCSLTDEASILSLQTVVSVQLFLLSMLRYNAASRLNGLVVRMAFQLGLHHCPMQFSAIPKKEVELRQRLFWSIYCIDRYICIRLGIPLAIRDMDVDVCFPTSERHGNGTRGQSDSDGRLDLLRLLAKNAEIRGSITELRNKSVTYRLTEIDEAVAIDAELTRWWNEVDEYLEPNTLGSFPISRHHQVTLVVLRHESIIALNKHTLATSKKTSTYDAALQNCISAARSIISALQKALETQVNLDRPRAEEEPGNSGLLWPSFTWAVWMSAFIMIYAANEDQVSQDVAIRFVDRALEVLKHLTLRGSVWPNASAAAIRHLRSKLIERRNRSKHTHIENRHNSKSGQREPLLRTPSGSILSRSNTNNNYNANVNNSQNLQLPQPSIIENPQFRGGHNTLRTRQDPRSARDESSMLDDSRPSASYNMPSSGFSSMSQPFASRQGRMFTEPTLSFGDDEGNEWAHRMGAYPGPELQIPNFEGAELFYGLDVPFWLSNDQWRGMG